MAGTTTNLGFIKPANGEYQDNWDQPLNANWDKADTEIYALKTEVINARGTEGTLKERLDNGLNDDGTLKATPEVETARNSPVSGQYSSLALRVGAIDLDVGTIRARESSLAAGLAYIGRDFYMDMPIEGANNFLTYSGDIVKVDGDPAPLVMNCGGYLQICRIEQDVQVSGAVGIKYVYAEFNSAGRVIESSTTGATGGGSLNEFTDASGQFVTKNVKAGDLLVITTGVNDGTYSVQSVTDDNNLIINGMFAQALSSQQYEIKDMYHPTITFESARVPSVGKCYLGECYFDGANITSAYPYAFKGVYESDYQAIDVSAVPTFSLNIKHKLGFIPKKMQIFAAQTNSEDDYHEILSVCDVTNDINYNFNDNGTGATLSVTGENYPTRSVVARVTREEIHIKNIKNSLFYTDYSGSAQSAGFLKVVLGR